MKDKLQLFAVVIITLMLSHQVQASENWKTLFDTIATPETKDDSVVTLQNVLSFTAEANPLFHSFKYQIEAAEENISQASVWANPEIGFEIEEFGWDAPAYNESEFAISLSQDFDFFGQRQARKNLALAESDELKLHLKLSAFDLYIIVKERFYLLAHAQHKVRLSQQVIDLSREIVENINFRLQKGATLHSELLLAQMEEQISVLNFEQATQEATALETKLVSLWGGELLGKSLLADFEPQLEIVYKQIEMISSKFDSSREMELFNSQRNLLDAEYELSIAESKPVVNLSTGFKRLEIDNSKSFMFGVSLPIPFINRNQGTQKSIQSNILSLEYEKKHVANEVNAMNKSALINLTQLQNRHLSLDTLLIPTATHAFQTLIKAYDAGRVPYTHLLEAERTLNELNFEHNDMLLQIHNLIIEIESRNGIVLNMKREN